MCVLQNIHVIEERIINLAIAIKIKIENVYKYIAFITFH